MLAFPLPLSDFAEHLHLEAHDFTLGEAVASSETGSGGALRIGYGDELWEGQATIAPNSRLAGRGLGALMNLLRRADASFLLCPPEAFPVEDRRGRGVRGYRPRIGNVGNDGQTVKIVGLPRGYRLTAGDFLGFEYSTPARRALHQIVTDARAGGTGNASGIVVTPYIRPGVVEDVTPVQFRRPAIKAVIVPDTYTGMPYLPGHRGGGTFRWRQVLL